MNLILILLKTEYMIDGVEEAMGELISSLTMISKILNRPTLSPLKPNNTGRTKISYSKFNEMIKL